MKLAHHLLLFSSILAIALACQPTVVAPRFPSEQGADFGDAPDPAFLSLLASNGARTLEITQFWLGDTENPSANTEPDSQQVDNDAFDDGLEEAIVIGDTFHLRFRTVMSETASPATVYFNLLADLNGDGQWQGSAEWVMINQEVQLAPGESTIIEAEYPYSFRDVWLRAALTDARVQVGNFPDGWDGTGQFKRGEIEDYLISAAGETPTQTPTSETTSTPEIGATLEPTATLGGIPTSTSGATSTSTGEATATPTSTSTSTPTLTPTPTDTPTSTPTATPTPKAQLSGISVTHVIDAQRGNVHMRIHVQDRKYDRNIWGYEVFFDGKMVLRVDPNGPILPFCNPSEFDISFVGRAPRNIWVHFLGRGGGNLGVVVSQEPQILRRWAPGVLSPPLRLACD